MARLAQLMLSVIVVQNTKIPHLIAVYVGTYVACNDAVQKVLIITILAKLLGLSRWKI